MEGRKHLTDWLRDAHAMEEQAITMLERQVERLESYPEMQSRIQQHIQESRRQADQIRDCITRLDGDTSMMKDVQGKIMGNVGALANSVASDEMVKNMLGNYAFEHFEIACYKSLIAAAEAVGDTHTARVCRDILREEEAMAQWIDSHIEQLTRAFMERDMAGMQAKR